MKIVTPTELRKAIYQCGIATIVGNLARGDRIPTGSASHLVGGNLEL